MNKKIKMNEFLSEMDSMIVISGRNLGYDIRKKIGLDKIDEDGNNYDFIFPENIISISTSFFLGLFGNSVRKFKNKQDFQTKYNIMGNSNLDRNVSDGIVDALNDVDGLS